MLAPQVVVIHEGLGAVLDPSQYNRDEDERMAGVTAPTDGKPQIAWTRPSWDLGDG